MNMIFVFRVMVAGMINNILSYTCNMNINSIIYRLLLVFLTLMPVHSALADDDYIEARRLREAGEILPLDNILTSLQQTHPGKVLEVEMEKKRDHIIYEIELLGDDGVIREIYIDARSGELIKIKEDD